MMMENWLSWAWVVMAVVLAIAEIFTAGFFLICFGIGAAVAALSSFFGVPPLGQFAIFVATSGVVLLLLRPFANRVTNSNAQLVGIDRLLGQQGLVMEPIDPASGQGLVRVNHESWSADSADGVPIAVGVTVLVVGIEGTHLKVRIVM